MEVSPEQSEAVSDGDITYDEYHEGFRRYQACMAERGFEVTAVGETGSMIDAQIPAAAVDSGDDAACYQLEFIQIDEMWQIAHQDELGDMEMLADCLRDNGLDVPEHRIDRVNALSEAGVDLMTCTEGKS